MPSELKMNLYRPTEDYQEWVLLADTYASHFPRANDAIVWFDDKWRVLDVGWHLNDNNNWEVNIYLREAK